MSRLFSRLENMGHDHDEGAPSVPPDELGRQADAHDRSAAPDSPGSPATHGAGSGTPAVTAPVTPPTIPPLVPGYSILSSLAVPRSALPVAARPVWPVRIWLVSLLLLVGVALLILAMPDRAPEAISAATSAAAPVAADRPEIPAPPSASTTITPLPAARTTRAETHSTAAAQSAAAPRPIESAACSDAMLAMNLCNKSSP